MTDTARTITPDSDAWPSFAPPWATHATIEHGRERSAFTFERAWSLPSVHRGTEPLIVVRVVQDWDAFAEHPEPPQIAAGPGDLWADWRREDVATALEEIAAALRSGQPAAPAAEQEGEDG